MPQNLILGKFCTRYYLISYSYKKLDSQQKSQNIEEAAEIRKKSIKVKTYFLHLTIIQPEKQLSNGF